MQTDQTNEAAIVSAIDTTSETTSAQPIVNAAQPVPSIETVSAITSAETAERKALAAKLAAKRKAASALGSAPVPATPAAKPAKRKAAKAASDAKPVQPAKPTQAEREAAQRAAVDERQLAKQAAARAVSAFYSGASKPFKAASDRFADLNFANAKAATARQAALMLALITYGAGNMRSDGTFTRGGFIVPARLVNPNAPANATVRAQPESGCFGNMLGRAADYVSGPKTGREQASAVYRLRVPAALSEIQAAFGDKHAKAAAKLLAGFDAKTQRV